LPTPLQRANNLERELGERSPRIWIKRDDLTGLAFGGNKARKLEYLVADAITRKATILVTEGAAQSNHARMTAAAAAISGLKCLLVLDARRAARIEGNLLLDNLLGAEILVVDGREERRSKMKTIASELEKRGERPYMIPTGGSVPLGALGYVRAMVELVSQLMDAGEAPARIYLPTGSQGTLAGLAFGAALLSAGDIVYGVAVEDDSLTLREDAAPIATGAAGLLGSELTFSADSFTVDDGYVGAGYGIPTPGGLEAIALLARTEAIMLDPVYTGKAMAGLIDHVRSGQIGPDDSVVFLHTGGGPSIFAHTADLDPLLRP
jgi:D-cysteine desulfhydrase family pyridoxal phosphate-dependent enzyme